MDACQPGRFSDLAGMSLSEVTRGFAPLWLTILKHIEDGTDRRFRPGTLIGRLGENFFEPPEVRDFGSDIIQMGHRQGADFGAGYLPRLR